MGAMDTDFSYIKTNVISIEANYSTMKINCRSFSAIGSIVSSIRKKASVPLEACWYQIGRQNISFDS
jgi:hypothetical protein